jgi:hypothetical protein
MAEYSKPLASRMPGKALLNKLDLDDRDEFYVSLIEALWDAHESDTLPQPIVDLLRDWVAYARFDKSSEAQERVAEARRQTASA